MTETKNQPCPTFSVNIEALNENGMGVGYYRDKKIVVEKTLPGEEVEVSYVPSRPKKDRIVLKKIKSLSDAPEISILAAWAFFLGR